MHMLNLSPLLVFSPPIMKILTGSSRGRDRGSPFFYVNKIYGISFFLYAFVLSWLRLCDPEYHYEIIGFDESKEEKKNEVP